MGGSDYRSIFKLGDFNWGQDCKPCMHIGPYGNNIALKYNDPAHPELKEWNCDVSSELFSFQTGVPYSVEVAVGGTDESFNTGKYMELTINGYSFGRCQIAMWSEDHIDVPFHLGTDVYNAGSTDYAGNRPAGVFDNTGFSYGV